MEEAGDEVPRDPFGHVKLDLINPGQWFAQQFAERIGADKVLVQKSGYFARSAPANPTDLELIASMVTVAVAGARSGTPGVVGHDEDRGGELRVIEFDRIAGHKPFDTGQEWWHEVKRRTGQLG